MHTHRDTLTHKHTHKHARVFVPNRIERPLRLDSTHPTGVSHWCGSHPHPAKRRFKSRRRRARHVRLFFGLRQDPPPFFSHHDPSIRVPPHHTIIANLENTVSDTSHAPMKKVRARKRAAVVASCRIARCRSDRIRSVLKSNNILTTSSKRSFFFVCFF